MFMGMMDKLKQMVSIPSEDDYAEEFEQNENDYYEEESQDISSKKTSLFSKPAKTSPSSSAESKQMQVVLVKPSRFEDATSIADYLKDNKTVVLNLENANREVSRRLIDFLSGTSYAKGGNIKKVAHSTYIFTPNNVDVLGDLILDELDGNIYLG